jgi:hypothetical protein
VRVSSESGEQELDMHSAWEFLKNGSSIFSVFIALFAVAISALSLGYVLYDRRSKVVLRARKGGECLVAVARRSHLRNWFKSQEFDMEGQSLKG